jgi:hypothetical protein
MQSNGTGLAFAWSRVLNGVPGHEAGMREATEVDNPMLGKSKISNVI